MAQVIKLIGKHGFINLVLLRNYYQLIEHKLTSNGSAIVYWKKLIKKQAYHNQTNINQAKAIHVAGTPKEWQAGQRLTQFSFATDTEALSNSHNTKNYLKTGTLKRLIGLRIHKSSIWPLHIDSIQRSLIASNSTKCAHGWV